MLNVLRFPSRTPAGVPVSDPFAEVRLLKTFARLGVYGAILFFTPFDVYVIGFSLAETLFIQGAYVGVATAAIELTFKQSLKLRKRSAYPATMLVEIGSLSSVDEAEKSCLHVLQRLFRVRRGIVVGAWQGDGLQLASRFACSREAATLFTEDYAQEIESCFESQAPAFFAGGDGRADGAVAHDEVLVLIPIVAFTTSIGVAAVMGDAKSADLHDAELLRGIGNALGLSIENLRQKEEIAAKEERLRAVVTAAPIVLFNTDADGRFTLLEGKGLQGLQIDPSVVLGRSVFEVFQHLPSVTDDFRRALAGELVTVLAEIGERTFEAELCPVVDASSKVTGVIGVATDVTQRKQAEELIRHMAYHDSLTGLPNRELFERTLAGAVADARKSKDPLAVLFVDLDGFKRVNDTLGHAEGDRLLKEIGQELQALVREGDMVARIGGDEFVVLLPGIADQEEATNVCDRFLCAIRRDWIAGNKRFEITASIGVAIYPKDGKDADALMRAADRAMYRAKDGGRDRYLLVSGNRA